MARVGSRWFRLQGFSIHPHHQWQNRWSEVFSMCKNQIHLTTASNPRCYCANVPLRKVAGAKGYWSTRTQVVLQPDYWKLLSFIDWSLGTATYMTVVTYTKQETLTLIWGMLRTRSVYFKPFVYASTRERERERDYFFTAAETQREVCLSVSSTKTGKKLFSRKCFLYNESFMLTRAIIQKWVFHYS